MTGIGRILSSLTRDSLCHGIFSYGTTTSLRLKNVRTLALNDQRWARSKKPADEDVVDKPIKFSTSKASQRNWNVARSLGSQYQRPWWKVLPISLFTLTFLLWCIFRGQSDIDDKLEKQLYEHLPGLLSDEENDVPSKSS